MTFLILLLLEVWLQMPDFEPSLLGLETILTNSTANV